VYLLSNTTLLDIYIYIYIIYYTEINYMFRHFSLAIFMLINENLVNSYTQLACIVYSGEVRGEVGMCCVGWVVCVQGFWYFSILG
jgi:hypothetical protein